MIPVNRLFTGLQPSNPNYNRVPISGAGCNRWQLPIAIITFLVSGWSFCTTTDVTALGKHSLFKTSLPPGLDFNAVAFSSSHITLSGDWCSQSLTGWTLNYWRPRTPTDQKPTKNANSITFMTRRTKSPRFCAFAACRNIRVLWTSCGRSATRLPPESKEFPLLGFCGSETRVTIR